MKIDETTKKFRKYYNYLKKKANSYGKYIENKTSVIYLVMNYNNFVESSCIKIHCDEVDVDKVINIWFCDNDGSRINYSFPYSEFDIIVYNDEIYKLNSFSMLKLKDKMKFDIIMKD